MTGQAIAQKLNEDSEMPSAPNPNRAYVKFLMPSMLVIFILTLFPIAVTVFLSLTSLSYTSARPTRFLGIDNYLRLLHDERFLHSLPVTIILIVVPVALQLILGFIIAVVMNEKLPFMGWLRFVFVAPMVLPPIVMGLMWRILYTPQLGGVNYFLSLAGIGGPAWLTDPKWALVAIVIAAVWGWTPFVGLMFLAAMQSFPEELYEAAVIDGATWVQTIRHITLPLLRPTIMVVGVFRVIEALAIFPIIFIVTNGGPAGATETVNFYGYISGFNNLRVGYSSAIIVVFFVLLLLMIAPSIRFLLKNMQVGS